MANIHINEAYVPALESTNRYLFLVGGAGSGKSVAAAQKIVGRAIRESPHRLLVVRKVARTLRSSVYQLLLDVIADHKATGLFEVNKTEMRFTYKPTGSEIICAGLDDVEKLKSIQGITSIWIEEATETSQDDYDQLDLRMRGNTASYKQIMATFNPISVNHWLKQRVERDDSQVIHTTYLDNDFIDADYKAVLDQKAAVNPNYARIYRDGEWGLPEAERPWAYNFDMQRNVGEVELNPKAPVYLSFDFNINPMTVTAHQYKYMKYYHTLYEWRVQNTGVSQVCDMIKASPIGNCHLIITGDASGRSRSATSGNINNYMIIQAKLKVHGGQLRVPKRNPALSESRTLSNHILAIHPNRLIHPRCEYLIADLQNVEGNDDDKCVPPDKMMGHLLDGMRYMDYTFFPYFVNDSAKLTANVASNND